MIWRRIISISNAETVDEGIEDRRPIGPGCGGWMGLDFAACTQLAFVNAHGLLALSYITYLAQQ